MGGAEGPAPAALLGGWGGRRAARELDVLTASEQPGRVGVLGLCVARFAYVTGPFDNSIARTHRTRERTCIPGRACPRNILCSDAVREEMPAASS